MNSIRLAALVRRHGFQIGIPLLVGIVTVSPTAAVTLRVTSATVQAPGDIGQICVQLETQGRPVAGTQNDLVWDGGCATLASTGNCTVNSAHGKDLSSAFPPPPPDFAFRAIIISLGDVGPIDDTELYCCEFQSEAAPGACCAIKITKVGASDPSGQALSASGVGGEICTASAGRAGGGLTGGQGFGTDRPSSAQDSGVTDQAPSEPAALAGEGGGEAAPAADVVLPGGEAEPVAPDAEASERETTEPPAGAPEEIARQEAAPPAEGEVGRPQAPAEQAPLAASPDTTPMTAAEEPTTGPSPPTAPEPTEPADTPTSKPAATVPPTAAQAAAAAAPSGDKGGWGCEIVPGEEGGLGPLAIGLVALLIVTRLRGTRAHTIGSPPKPSA